MASEKTISKIKVDELEALSLYGDAKSEGALTLKVGKTPPPGVAS